MFKYRNDISPLFTRHQIEWMITKMVATHSSVNCGELCELLDQADTLGYHVPMPAKDNKHYWDLVQVQHNQYQLYFRDKE